MRQGGYLHVWAWMLLFNEEILELLRLCDSSKAEVFAIAPGTKLCIVINGCLEVRWTYPPLSGGAGLIRPSSKLRNTEFPFKGQSIEMT